ncbi:hypothetical protein MHU86_5484 [Fragilaria crotonensis]|nr:hypothetical protein MHU86_5484 [Fragilaria crotonensis]
MDVGQEEQVGLGADNYNDTSTPLDEADDLEEYQGDADLDAMIYNSRSCNGVDKQPTGPAVVRTSIVSPTIAYFETSNTKELSTSRQKQRLYFYLGTQGQDTCPQKMESSHKRLLKYRTK